MIWDYFCSIPKCFYPLSARRTMPIALKSTALLLLVLWLLVALTLLNSTDAYLALPSANTLHRSLLTNHIAANRIHLQSQIKQPPRIGRTSRSSTTALVRLFAAQSHILAYVTKPSQDLVHVPLTKHFLASTSVIVSFLSPTIAGGLLSGGLHAISGPDHLAALLPPSVGKPGWYGLKLGATWGFGHAISAVSLGLCAFFLKGRISSQFQFFQKLSAFTEIAVGVSERVLSAAFLLMNTVQFIINDVYPSLLFSHHR